MSNNDSSTPVFDSDAFDQWIAGGSVAKRSVPIYAAQGLQAEFEKLEREYELEKEAAVGGVEMAGSRLSELEAEMEDLYERWQASKSLWTVCAVNGEQRQELAEANPDEGLEAISAPEMPEPPAKPEPLSESASDAKKRSHEVAMQRYLAAEVRYKAELAAYEKEAHKFNTEQNIRVIAAATEKIEFADGRVVEGVTVERVRRMHQTLGDRQMLSLLTAINLATAEEPEIPAPFWRASSEKTQDN